MALNHIRIDRTKPMGVKLLRFAAVQREALSLAQELRDVMDNMTDGVDYTYLETEFGLAAGKGQTTYNHVNAYLSKVDTNASVDNVRRDVKAVINYFAG